MGTDPFFTTIASTASVAVAIAVIMASASYFPLDETGAVELYSEATTLDDYPGQYPPDDTGCDGLTIAKTLQKHQMISGYQHTFSTNDALMALGKQPGIFGISWFNDMFNPDSDGRVHPTGSLAGGHEIVADEIDAENERVWFTNSWGLGWGVQGKFYLTFNDLDSLLHQNGDATFFTPISSPAPTPTPGPETSNAIFAQVLRNHNWVNCRHVGTTKTVATAAKKWLNENAL